MPKTKQIESRMFDFPEPLRPVMALKWGSNLEGSGVRNVNGGVEGLELQKDNKIMLTLLACCGRNHSPSDDSTMCVRLEAVDDNFFDMHDGALEFEGYLYDDDVYRQTNNDVVHRDGSVQALAVLLQRWYAYCRFPVVSLTQSEDVGAVRHFHFNPGYRLI